MALLRTILAGSQSAHRRRGSVILVLGGYLGAFIPILLLIAFPGATWAISSAIAVLCVAYPLSILMRGRGSRGTVPRRPPPEGRMIDGSFEEPVAAPGGGAAAPSVEPRQRVPMRMLLVIQCVSASVVAAFLTYHPMDLEQRIGQDGDALVRASAVVLASALAGLLLTAVALLHRPGVFGTARGVLIGSALLLACSIGLRGLVDALPLVVTAAFLSGAAVGANSSTLLVAALESAPRGRAGRFIGAFSAAGALGQFIGPVLGLFLLGLMPGASVTFSLLFLGLAGLPVAWALALAFARPNRGPEAGQSGEPRTVVGTR